MRRGCVLMIVIFSVIAFVLSIFFYIFKWPETQVDGTSGFAYVIEEALEQYKSDQDRYPPSGNAAVVRALYGENPRQKEYLKTMRSMVRDGEFTDYWKLPLKIEFPPGGKPSVRSAGPNGLFGDADDVTSQPIRDKIASGADKRVE